MTGTDKSPARRMNECLYTEYGRVFLCWMTGKRPLEPLRPTSRHHSVSPPQLPSVNQAFHIPGANLKLQPLQPRVSENKRGLLALGEE